MQTEKLDRSSEIAVLQEYPALTLRLPRKLVVQNCTLVRAGILAEWEKRGTPSSLILDLRDTSQLDSSGVGLLLELSHKAQQSNIPISLCNLRGGPRRMLSRTGVLDRFTVYDSLGDAMPQTLPAGNVPAKRSRPRSHRALWIFDALLVLAILGAGIYLFWQLGAYRGKLDQLQQAPPMQRVVAGISRRLDAAEQVWRNWTHQSDALAQRMQRMDDDTRRQTQNIVAASEQHTQNELNQRTAELQGRMDRIESEQQANDSRLDSLERQVNGTPVDTSQVESSANSIAPATAAVPADDLNRRITRLEEQTSQNQHAIDSLRSKSDRRRVEFELSLNRPREIAPGISMVINGTDVPQQKVNGRIWLARDHQSVWLRGQAPEEAVVFYSQKNDAPRELVITHVTASTVSGFLLLPVESGGADAHSGNPVSSSR